MFGNCLSAALTHCAYFRGLILKTTVDHSTISMAKLADALDDDVPRFDFDFDSHSPPTRGIVFSCYRIKEFRFCEYDDLIVFFFLC